MVYLERNKSLLPNSVIDTTNNKITITNSVTSYTATDFDAILEFVQITNPLSTKPTDSFQVILRTSANNLIARLTSGVIYSSTAGAITAMQATPASTLVGTSTSVLFSFKPAHRIPISSRILVTIPDEASITAKDVVSCSLSELSQIQISATCTGKFN